MLRPLPAAGSELPRDSEQLMNTSFEGEGSGTFGIVRSCSVLLGMVRVFDRELLISGYRRNEASWIFVER